MNYDTYRKQYACFSCGAEPSVEDYHQWLTDELPRIRRETKRMREMIERNDPLELQTWLWDHQLSQILNRSLRADLLQQLIPHATNKAFLTHDFSKVVTDG
jgi:acyl carrier protein phosphodiesterase